MQAFHRGELPLRRRSLKIQVTERVKHPAQASYPSAAPRVAHPLHIQCDSKNSLEGKRVGT